MAPVSPNFIDSGWLAGAGETMEEELGRAAAAQEGPRPPCSNDTKRHKEMENVALQTSLNLGPREEEQEVGPEPVGSRAGAEQEQEEQELTQTDHLNKRLLTSFLEKINQPSFNFANLQQLSNQPEDSNKMQEDW